MMMINWTEREFTSKWFRLILPKSIILLAKIKKYAIYVQKWRHFHQNRVESFSAWFQDKAQGQGRGKSRDQGQGSG